MVPSFKGRILARFVRAISALALSLIFIASYAAPSFAIGGTTGNIGGTVIDAQSKMPVPGVTVYFTSPSQTTHVTTDRNGAFQAVNLPVDTYAVGISLPGYQSLVINGVNVIGDQTVNLGPQTLQKQLATIGRTTSRSASSAVQANQTIDQVTISGARVAQAAGKTFSTNANQLVLAAPGATLTAGGAISIRGSTANDVGYQFEGINLREPSQGAQSVNTINGLNSIQVVGGAGDASQGNVGAGVVNYTVKRGARPAFGSIDLESGGPYYYHQLGFEYGFASANNHFSNYTSYIGYTSGGYSASAAFGGAGGIGSDAAAVGAYFNTSLQQNSDLVNNFVYRFGKDNEQNLQILFRNRTLDTYGNNGGIGGAPCTGVTVNCGGINYYLYDPGFYTGASAFYSSPSAAYLAAGGPLTSKYLELAATVGLTGSIPLNSAGTPITTANHVSSNIFNLLSFAYTRPVGSNGAINLRQYTYDTRTNTDNTIGFRTSSNTVPQYNSTGGHISGVQGEYTFRLGDKNTLSINGKIENDHPYSDRIGPYYSLLALGGGGAAGTLATSDWLNPIDTSQAISATNPCPVTGGCYLYNQGFAQGGASFWGASGVPRIPLGFIGYREADYQFYGFGIRDQITLSDKLRLDFGVREDGANYHQASNPYIASTMNSSNPQDDDPQLIGGPYKHPSYVEPRFAAAYQATKADSIRVGYGRSASFPVAQGFGTPVNLYNAPFGQLSKIAALDTAANPGCGSGVNTSRFKATGNFYAQCNTYGQQFYWAVEQIDAPDDGGTLTPFFNNYDLTLQHQFKNGMGLRLTGFAKRGYNQPSFVLQAQGPIDPTTLLPSYTIYGGSSLGLTKTTGAEVYFTLPDKIEGFSGFLQATYINALSNIPPGSNGEEGTSPVYSVTAVRLGNIYRVGYISPFTTRAGISYRHNGFRVNPIVSYDRGYPITQGNLTPFGADQNSDITINGQYQTITATNLKYATPYGFGTASGVNYSKAFNYVDPAYAGSYYAPNIAATRGTASAASPGGLLSPQRVGFDMSLEYKANRNTFGAYIFNVLNNQYGPSSLSSGSEPAINDRYQAVSTGVAGPLTGTVSGAGTNTSLPFLLGNRNYSSFGPNGLTPYYLRPNGSPRSIKLYYQLAL